MGTFTGCLDGMAAAAQPLGDDLAALLPPSQPTRPPTARRKAEVTSVMIRTCCIACIAQCAINVGTVIDDKMPRVAPAKDELPQARMALAAHHDKVGVPGRPHRTE